MRIRGMGALRRPGSGTVRARLPNMSSVAPVRREASQLYDINSIEFRSIMIEILQQASSAPCGHPDGQINEVVRSVFRNSIPLSEGDENPLSEHSFAYGKQMTWGLTKHKDSSGSYSISVLCQNEYKIDDSSDLYSATSGMVNRGFKAKIIQPSSTVYGGQVRYPVSLPNGYSELIPVHTLNADQLKEKKKEYFDGAIFILPKESNGEDVSSEFYKQCVKAKSVVRNYRSSYVRFFEAFFVEAVRRVAASNGRCQIVVESFPLSYDSLARLMETTLDVDTTAVVHNSGKDKLVCCGRVLGKHSELLYKTSDEVTDVKPRRTVHVPGYVTDEVLLAKECPMEDGFCCQVSIRGKVAHENSLIVGSGDVNYTVPEDEDHDYERGFVYVTKHAIERLGGSIDSRPAREIRSVLKNFADHIYESRTYSTRSASVGDNSHVSIDLDGRRFKCVVEPFAEATLKTSRYMRKIKKIVEKAKSLGVNSDEDGEEHYDDITLYRKYWLDEDRPKDFKYLFSIKTVENGVPGRVRYIHDEDGETKGFVISQPEVVVGSILCVDDKDVEVVHVDDKVYFISEGKMSSLSLVEASEKLKKKHDVIQEGYDGWIGLKGSRSRGVHNFSSEGSLSVMPIIGLAREHQRMCKGESIHVSFEGEARRSVRIKRIKPGESYPSLQPSAPSEADKVMIEVMESMMPQFAKMAGEKVALTPSDRRRRAIELLTRYTNAGQNSNMIRVRKPGNRHWHRLGKCFDSDGEGKGWYYASSVNREIVEALNTPLYYEIKQDYRKPIRIPYHPVKVSREDATLISFSVGDSTFDISQMVDYLFKTCTGCFARRLSIAGVHVVVARTTRCPRVVVIDSRHESSFEKNKG